MKSHIFYTLGISMLLLSSCSNDDFADDTAISSPQSLTESGSVLNEVQGSTSSVLTRASNDKWEDGDAIGVSGYYADGTAWFSNGKFTRCKHGNFESATSYAYKDEQAHSLTAYYPYNASVTAANPLLPITPYLKETSNGTTAVGSEPSCDYMFATGTATKDSLAKLTFNHVNSRVQIIIHTGYDISWDKLRTASVSLTASFSGKFNTQTGEVSVGEKSTYPLIWESGALISGSLLWCTIYKFVAPPQNTSGILLTISFKDGTTQAVDLSTSGVSEWKGGKYYRYDVMFSKNISTTSTQSDISDITQ